MVYTTCGRDGIKQIDFLDFHSHFIISGIEYTTQYVISDFGIYLRNWGVTRTVYMH